MTLSEAINLLIANYKCDEVVFGSMYILPDGTLLDLGSDGYGHARVSQFLEDNHLEKGFEFGKASKILKELGWIRLNTKLRFVDLPDNKITNEQEKQLIYILDYMKPDYEINVKDQHKIYSNRLPEEIIKLIKRFYSSGKLYEKLVD